MKILVIGSGGREHALAWKLAQSEKVTKVYVAPGNGGTALEPHLQNLPIQDLGELCRWAQAEKIDLTVVGPEAPLAAGVVDTFRAAGLRIFGPTQAAAQLDIGDDVGAHDGHDAIGLDRLYRSGEQWLSRKPGKTDEQEYDGADKFGHEIH